MYILRCRARDRGRSHPGGLFWPDVDQLLAPLIGHRSILTHSVLAPLLLLTVWRHRVTAPTVAWFSFGIATHLLADLFPRAWVGFALVQLPLGLGNLGSLSPLWIGGNALAALWLCEWLLRHEGLAITRLH